MAPLNEVKLRYIWRGLMRFLSQYWHVLPDVSKHEFYDAIVAADIFCSDNEALLNSAFPNPFRANAQPWLKMLVYVCIFAARYSPDDEIAKQLLARVIGTEVD